MIFENKYKAREWFLNYKPFEGEYGDLFFTYDLEWGEWRMGDWFLFQHHDCNSHPHKISRPILGLFIGTCFWDMALVVHYTEENRAWMYSHKYQTTGTDGTKYDWLIGFGDYEMQQQSLWHDNIFVLGHWKQKPSKKELREALLKTKTPKQHRFLKFVS